FPTCNFPNVNGPDETLNVCDQKATQKPLSNPISPSCRCGRSRRRFLHMLFIPGKIPFQSIALVTWTLDAMKLVRIDNQLSINTKASQCLIHLLTSLNRNVKVAFTAHE